MNCLIYRNRRRGAVRLMWVGCRLTISVNEYIHSYLRTGTMIVKLKFI